jgi:hypothetical protein
MYIFLCDAELTSKKEEGREAATSRNAILQAVQENHPVSGKQAQDQLDHAYCPNVRRNWLYHAAACYSQPSIKHKDRRSAGSFL